MMNPLLFLLLLASANAWVIYQSAGQQEYALYNSAIKHGHLSGIGETIIIADQISLAVAIAPVSNVDCMLHEMDLLHEKDMSLDAYVTKATVNADRIKSACNMSPLSFYIGELMLILIVVGIIYSCYWCCLMDLQ